MRLSAAGLGHTDCERIVDGALAQPVLALSSLAYVVAGIVVACWAIRWRAPLAVAAAVALAAVGVGSIAYHGPQPWWAEPAHDVPIVALVLVCAAILVRGSRRWSVWGPAAGVLALGFAAYVAGRSGSPLCRPDSLWQFHGVWHTLTAVAAAWAVRAVAPRSCGTVSL